MRKLSNAQKSIIILNIKTGLLDLGKSIDQKLFEDIEAMNDYETLWQDTTRFINDYILSDTGGE